MIRNMKEDSWMYNVKWILFMIGIMTMILLGIYDWNKSIIFYPEKETNEFIDYKNFKTISSRIHLNGYTAPVYGNVKRYFQNNPTKLQSKGHYTNGIRDGYWEEWYDNGQKKEELTSDFYYKWNENGKKLLKENSRII